MKEIVLGFAKVAGALVLLALIAFAAIAASVVWTVLHGDDDTREKTAVSALACRSVRVVGDVATGCGRTCELQTYESSASWFSSYVCNPLDGGRP